MTCDERPNSVGYGVSRYNVAYTLSREVACVCCCFIGRLVFLFVRVIC